MEKEKEENGTGYFLAMVPSVKQAVLSVRNAPLEAGGGDKAALRLFFALSDYAQFGTFPTFTQTEWLIRMMFEVLMDIVDNTKEKLDV